MLGKQTVGLPGMIGSELEAAKGPSPSSVEGKHWSHATGTAAQHCNASGTADGWADLRYLWQQRINNSHA